MALDINTIQRIKNHLYYYKKLKILDLSYCNLNDEMCNELSDGIMKAKCLEKLYIPGNKMTKSLSNILYNLAFQPSIRVLDISNNKSCDLKETAISLFKLIKMSQTLETIIANNIPDFNSYLTNDFFNALGDNNNLLYLDLSQNGKISDINNLGMSIAFNALKNGSLEYLDLSNCITYYNYFESLIDSMSISESKHNEWYGFQFNGNIVKDSNDYYNKNFHCNLKTLVLKNSHLYSTKYNLSKSPIEILLNKSTNLDTLILDNSSLNNDFIIYLSEAIKSPNNLKCLSLSNCCLKGEKFKSFLPCFYKIEEIKEKEEKEAKEEKEEKEEKKEKKKRKGK